MIEIILAVSVAVQGARSEPTRPLAGTIEVCVFSAPDVPTTETLTNQTILPNEIFEYDDNPPKYTKVLSVPTDFRVAGIFRMDTAGTWLLSSESPTRAGGVLPVPAEARDIVKRDSLGGFAFFFCGASVAGAIPAGSRIDSFYLDGGDGGSLVLSFDVPTIIGNNQFDPSDLVRYTRTAGGTCASWQLDPSNPVFDASGAGGGVPLSSNSVGAAKYGGRLVFSQDAPTTLSPPGIQVVPGQIVAWDGAGFSVLATLAGWPVSSNLHGVSNTGNPGVIGDGLRIGKSTDTPGNIVLSWTASCSANGKRSAVYEGSLGNWYNHAPVKCTDLGDNRTEEIAPSTGSSYYLVVPWNAQGEGSYGVRSNGQERPSGANACGSVQVLAACPGN